MSCAPTASLQCEATLARRRKTTALLAKCTAEPLSFAERLGLLSQEITENDAHTRYVGAKSLRHGAARITAVSGSLDVCCSSGWPKRERDTMKTTQWESCSEASIDAELYRLRKVRTNLSECIDVLREDHAREKMTAALSFVQMAIDALTHFQAAQGVGISSRDSC